MDKQMICESVPQQTIYTNQITSEQQRVQENAIFLSQNKNTAFFNIQNYTTNFLGNRTQNMLAHRYNNINKKKNTSATGIPEMSTSANTSTLEISKETLIERECENSPLFFKISGCVAYCQQLGACCIFYNSGITKQQMKILYSVACQREIFDEACKLYKNSIPLYSELFQLIFSVKLKQKFKLLGLSEDTLLLKVKSETPSSRNRFLYNAAMLQLQMLRYDFIISPNISQYYVKQFLSDIPMCPVNIPSVGDIITNTDNIVSDTNYKITTIEDTTKNQNNKHDAVSNLLIDNNNDDDNIKHNTKREKYVNASDFKVVKNKSGKFNTASKTKRQTIDDDGYEYDEYSVDGSYDDNADSELFEDDENSSISNGDYEDYTDVIDDGRKHMITVKNTSSNVEKQLYNNEDVLMKEGKQIDDNYIVNKSLHKINKKPSSIISSIASSYTNIYDKNPKKVTVAKSLMSSNTASSVDFVIPSSNQSDTGITDNFARLQCNKNYYTLNTTTTTNNKTQHTQSSKKNTNNEYIDGGGGGSYPSVYNKNNSSNINASKYMEINKCKNTKHYAPSSTGITDNIGDLTLNVNSEFEDECEHDGTISYVYEGYDTYNDIIALKVDDITNTSPLKIDTNIDLSTNNHGDGKTDGKCLNILSKMIKSPIFDTRNSYVNNEGMTVYNPKYLVVFSKPETNDDLRFINELLSEYIDLHGDIQLYINLLNYKRGDSKDINRAAGDMNNDPTNRLKQAAFLYLISNSSLISLIN